ncbi:F-box protein SKIP23-like [Quercus lobata]|uniref:KIB1-4 beta-propeller domain-containing protein n=1 Tax=Quercus lobata TaxID=97700 RepID=A0A7N2KT25_QUELO|nr:F-box protein SKIP23-like [Quercus lobata]
MNSREIEMAVDWTQLPRDILEAISKNLTIYTDYLRFQAVCHTWRISVPKIPHHLPPQLPWLMLPLSQQSQSQSHRPFLDLSDHKIHLLNLPEAASHLKRRCGSSHGWLVILDETPTILLLNPLTRAKLNLPPLFTFPNVVTFNYSEIGKEYALRSLSGNIYRRSLKEMRDSFIKKLVLSSSPALNTNFVALAILNQTGDLVFCKNGDQAWTFIHDARFFCEDVIYDNDLFYAVDKNGGVAVCDVHGENSPSVSIIERFETPRIFGGDMQYLVKSGDDLLLVTRYLDLGYEDGDPYNSPTVFYKTVQFEVFRMDFSGGPPMWERVWDLGDRMLFVGENSSLSLSASDFRGGLGNCIYYTDDYCESNYDGAFRDYDIGIFKLWDGSIEALPCYHPNSHSQLHWPPLWVSPNPC